MTGRGFQLSDARIPRPPVALVLGLIFVSALAIRLAGIGQSLFGDELTAWWEIRGMSASGIAHSLAHGIDMNPPFFFLLARASEQLGDSTVMIRLPSIVSGALLIPAVFVLAKRLDWGPVIGLVAAAMTAVNVTAIYYSVEARPYALLSVLCAASTIALLTALRSDQGLRWWAVYATASVLVVYTQYSGVWVLAAQAAWVARRHRDRLRVLLLSNAAAAAAFAPWAIWTIGPSRAESMLARFAFAPLEWVRLLVHQIVGFPFYISIDRLPGPIPAAIMIGCLAAAAVAKTVSRRSREPADKTDGALGLTVLLAIAAPLGMIVAGLSINRDLMAVRYFSSSLPYMMLALAALLVGAGRKSGVVFACVFVGTGLIGATRLLEPAFQRPDTRAAAHLIDSKLPQTAAIADAFLSANGVSPLGPYLRDPLRQRPDPWRLGPSFEKTFARAQTDHSDLAAGYTNCPVYRDLVTVTRRFKANWSMVDEATWPGLSCGIGVRVFRLRR